MMSVPAGLLNSHLEKELAFLYYSPVWPYRIIGTPVSALWLLGIFFPIVRPNAFTALLS
jgi:hypothetical protein